MLRKIVFTVLIGSLVGIGWTWLEYRSFSANRLQQLSTESQLIETALGPVEYVLEAGAEPVLLVIHGTPGGYDAPDVIEVPGMRTLSLSRPGYLRTPLAAARSPRDQAALYDALLEALEIEYAVVAGYSGGGPSALALAGLYPQRVVALIMLAGVVDSIKPVALPAWLGSDMGFWLALSTARNLLGEQDLVRSMVSGAANQQRVLRSPQSTREVLALAWNGWPPSQRLAGFNNDNEQFVALDLPLDDVRSPTLIIHGSADQAVPYYHAELLSQIVPQAQLHTLDGADHFFPITHRGEVTRVAQSFLYGLAGEQDYD